MRLPLAMPLLAFVLVGCAGATRGGGKPVYQFPSQVELTQIASATSKDSALHPEVASVDEWKVEATSGTEAQAYAAQTPWDELLDEVATPLRAVPTVAMRCLAQELSRVYLLNGKAPDAGLHRFLAGRCGALVSMAETLVWKQDVPEAVYTSLAFKQMSPQLHEELRAYLTGGGMQVGMGLSREKGKVVMVLAKAKPLVELKSFSRMIDAQSQIVLRGRLTNPATELSAHVNHGSYGVKRCEVDEALPLPEFRVRCQLAAADDHAWIQVNALPPGRVLGTSVLSVLALRTPDAAHTYTRRALGDARPVQDDQGFRATVIELVNRVRAQASMPPLQAAERQSQAVASLVTPFYNAVLNEGEAADEMVNRISLGLMAGWAVDTGLIRNATLVTGVDVAAPDAARWLSDALDSPWGRLVLLDPEAKTLALGARVQNTPGVLAAIAVSYRFFSEESQEKARAGELIERLARVRKARGLGETVEVRDINGMQEALRSIEQREATPAEAMQEVMETVAHATGLSVRGLVWETHDLDVIEFPNELLRQRGKLMLGAGITVYRPVGAAWGQYAVIFVVIDLAEGGEV